MYSLPSTLFFLSNIGLILAGSVNNTGPCNVGNNRLQAGNFQFWSECNSVTFCNDQGTCVPKRCRKDDFPFGYTPGQTLPPKCPKGEFCPDEGSDCQPVLAAGSPCQLNRDDQCEGPPDFKDLADTTGRGLNFNGSVCLNNVCMFADAALGSTCIVENTPYIAYGPGPEGEFIDIVSRDNCKIGLYCDTSSKVCMNTKVLGESCTADKECDTYNCEASGVCGQAAATPRHLGIWVYVLVGFGIIGGMVGTLVGLYFAHRKQRDAERAKRAQYWKEQNAFHQNLMQMRETARAFILSLPQNGGSKGQDYNRDYSDESSTPLKGSGLRHYMGDDGSSDFDDNVGVRKDMDDFRRF